MSQSRTHPTCRASARARFGAMPMDLTLSLGSGKVSFFEVMKATAPPEKFAWEFWLAMVKHKLRDKFTSGVYFYGVTRISGSWAPELVKICNKCLECRISRTYPTSTCVKSSGLVESRLDDAFTMGLDARLQYNWKSVWSTKLFGCCVYMQVRGKVTKQ